MSSGTQWVWAERDGIGLHTIRKDEQGVRIDENYKAGCPPEALCCDNLPQSVNAIVWLSEPVSGPPGEDPVETIFLCERIGLSLDPIPQPDGSWIFRGNLTSGLWTGYVNDPAAEITAICNNVNQIPGDDDCSTAITAYVNILQFIRDGGCCCDPFCFAGGVGPGECIGVPPPPAFCILTTAPISGSPSNVFMGIWIYELVTEVATSDTFDGRPAGQVIAGTNTDAGLGGTPLPWVDGLAGGQVITDLGGGNRVYSSNTLESRALIESGQMNVQATATVFTPNNSVQEAGLVFRWVSQNQFVKCVLYNNRYEIAVVDNGPDSVQYSQAGTFAQGVPHSMVARVVGNECYMDVNDTGEIGGVISPDFGSGTQHGIVAQSQNVGVDDYYIELSGAGGSATRVGCEPTPRPEAPCPQVEAPVVCEGSEPAPVELSFLPAEVRIVAKLFDLAVEDSPVSFTFNPAEVRIVAQTFELRVESPPTGDCCQGPGNTITATMHAEWESPGGGGAVCCFSDSATLQEEPPQVAEFRAWSGTATNSQLFPSTYSVRVTCLGTGPSPSFSVSINGSISLPVYAQDCTPPFGFTTDNTNVTLADVGLQIVQGQTLSCGAQRGDEGDVAIWVDVSGGGGSAPRPVNACNPP